MEDWIDESLRKGREEAQIKADKWIEKVRAWAASFPQRGLPVDDSRESIYGESEAR